MTMLEDDPHPSAPMPTLLPDDLVGVCVVGASAGGLEALEIFFSNVPLRTGVAWVVVQHLSPDHKSLMAELLARHTRLPVMRAEDGQRLLPDTIFLNPPKTNLLFDGATMLVRPHAIAGLHLPVDACFASLGSAMHERAVGVVLSGTGSDGTRGARELKADGGFVIAQDPGESQFDGMPRSIMASGLADMVLPAAEMPARIVALMRGTASEQPAATQIRPPLQDQALQRILTLLRDRTGNDYSGYKSTTLVRRIERRLQVHSGLTVEGYIELLRESPREVQDLQKDLLINVTRFFRDAEAFEALETMVIPALLADRSGERDLRVWVPGCSTGEEAYSLTMLLLEAMQATEDPRELRVFATDVDAEAVEIAAAGWYPDSVAADIPSARLARFFLADGGGYRVTRELRSRVIFARQNLLSDPPMTRMDLVSCRNMLIYFGPDLQQRSIALLTYALRAKGVLFLGPSESLGGLQHHFEPINAKWKIFRALTPGRQTLAETFPTRASRSEAAERRPLASYIRRNTTRGGADDPFLERVYQELVGSLDARCLVLDAEGTLLHSFGDLRDLLRVPSGRSSLDVAKLLPEPLAGTLRSGLLRAVQGGPEVAYTGLKDGSESLTMRIRPVDLGAGRERVFLVFLQPSNNKEPQGIIPTEAVPDASSRARILQLESEIQHVREHLQTTVEELETSNEELQATNEELLASNEELQSTNEELQSVNEELQTVNAEHQEKILELTEMTSDIENLLRTTGVALVFLDTDARIRRFTSGATILLNLMPQDIGRPISHLTSRASGFDVEALARRVQDTHRTEHLDLSMADGTLYHVRATPYDDASGRATGTILSLVDATDFRRGEKRLQGILDALPSSVAILNPEGTITQTNQAWRSFAQDNGATSLLQSGVGLNYLAVCTADKDDVSAAEAARGLRDVLAGRSDRYTLEYPCHSATEERWFLMQVTPHVSEAGRGAVVQHLDITSIRRK
jgi:two-component system CheB/CheR fusion protein